MKALTNPQRILGGLYGSLVGDALGVPVEFKPHEDRVAEANRSAGLFQHFINCSYQ